ncbi:MAG: glycosyltransferase family 4 protein [Bryobacterales bacterium]|nr:glycosyltransferase family 4 protein [Bryobacterales bacterium]
MLTIWFDYQPDSVHDFAWTLNHNDMPLWQYCSCALNAIRNVHSIAIGQPSDTKLYNFCKHNAIDYFQGATLSHISNLKDLCSKFHNHIFALHPLCSILFDVQHMYDVLLKEYIQHKGVIIALDLPQPLYACVVGEDLFSLCDMLPRGAFQGGVGDNELANWFTAYEAAILNVLEPVPRVKRVRLYGSKSPTPKTNSWRLSWKNRHDFEAIVRVASEISDRSGEALLDALWRCELARARKRYFGCTPQASAVEPVKGRVLFASNPSAFSGSEQCLINTMKAISASGVELHCLVAQEGVFAEKARMENAIVHCPQRGFAGPGVDNALLLSQYVKKIRPAIIHCNAVVGPHLLSLAKNYSIPILQWARRAVVDDMSEHYLVADRITAVSKFVSQQLDMMLGCSVKTTILYDCIDTSHFAPSMTAVRSIRRELKICDESFVVLCVARFSASKRHRILIQAFAEFLRIVSDATLLLVGEPDSTEPDVFDDAMNLIRERRLTETIKVIAFDCDIRSYEQAADVVVLCSINEALGTVVLESMALGKTVIVSNSGGLPEMIENEVSGLVCDVDSVTSLAEQLLRSYRDAELVRELGIGARRAVTEKFSLHVHRNRLSAIYAEFGVTLAVEGRNV